MLPVAIGYNPTASAAAMGGAMVLVVDPRRAKQLRMHTARQKRRLPHEAVIASLPPPIGRWYSIHTP
jgi:hypothetical protein